jgi:hypothetical protein
MAEALCGFQDRFTLANEDACAAEACHQHNSPLHIPPIPVDIENEGNTDWEEESTELEASWSGGTPN